MYIMSCFSLIRHFNMREKFIKLNDSPNAHLYHTYQGIDSPAQSTKMPDCAAFIPASTANNDSAL